MSDKTPVPTTTMELRMQQLATDLHALQAELERLLVEKRSQAKQIASLTGERNHLAQQHAAALSSNEQAMRIIDTLRARLEEASAERAVLQSSYERSQVEHEREHEQSVAENSALAARLNVTEANLNATQAKLNVTEANLNATQAKLNVTEANLNATQAKLNVTEANLNATQAELLSLAADNRRTLDKLQTILASRGWKALSLYYRFRKALSRLRPSFSSDEQLIAKSGLFDASWYLSQYPDVGRAGIDPLKHYLQHGAAEGRDPNPYFDTDWYLSHNPDVAAAGINPLIHYLRYGAVEQRDPSSGFDAREYIRIHPDVLRDKLNPLAHFLRGRG